VLINGLQHLAPQRLKSNLQIVETFIKAFYLPETEYLHWVRTHPEYTKSQAIGLINLVATANNWKRKTRVDMIDRVEAGDLWWRTFQGEYLDVELVDEIIAMSHAKYSWCTRSSRGASSCKLVWEARCKEYFFPSYHECLEVSGCADTIFWWLVVVLTFGREHLTLSIHLSVVTGCHAYCCLVQNTGSLPSSVILVYISAISAISFVVWAAQMSYKVLSSSCLESKARLQINRWGSSLMKVKLVLCCLIQSGEVQDTAWVEKDGLWWHCSAFGKDEVYYLFWSVYSLI